MGGPRRDSVVCAPGPEGNPAGPEEGARLDQEGEAALHPARKKTAIRPGSASAGTEYLAGHAEGTFHDDGFIFATSTGSPVEFQNIRNQYFKPMLKRLGPPDIRLYDLRHTAAPILLKQKVSPKVVQEPLGHSTVMLTMDTYSHVLEGMQEAATEAMRSALGGSRLG
jgi:integrase